MSTDVYFDFRTPPELPDLYEPVRVAYVSNLVAGCTLDLWTAFQKEWGGWITLEETDIPGIVADWRAIYEITQKPENARACAMSFDILPPEKVEAVLRERVGMLLDFRVD